MGVRVPHRLGLAALVPLALRAPPGGDGVNDLPVSEGVPVPVEDAVGGLEGLRDGDDRGGLSLVSLPAADLERKP